MTENIPRDPSKYSPTVHAGQQAKHRNISWDQVAETIEEGEVRQSHEENCVLLVQEFASPASPVGVVVNYVKGVIITVEYRE